MNITEDFEIHDKLNPILFDGNTLKPDVRKKLLEIAFNFKKFLKAPIDLIDIQLVGSNASYNYTEKSDIDIHLIANFDIPKVDPELLKLVYNMKKSEYNQEHNITIKGIEVELYVQDVQSNLYSNGIYSVAENNWVKEPKPIKHITKHNIEKDLEEWKTIIATALSSNKYETINNALNKLYLLRANSLASEGEYGKGNSLFKAIRDKGWIGKLREKLLEVESKQLSLESYTQGQFVNRFDL